MQMQWHTVVLEVAGRVVWPECRPVIGFGSRRWDVKDRAGASED